MRFMIAIFAAMPALCGCAAVSTVQEAFRYGAEAKLIFNVVDASLCVDYNRDGKIDGTDEQTLRAGGILRHWINDDQDENDVADDESDLINQWLSANYRNAKIDGRCDLLDFTPVRLNIRGLLDELENDSNLTFKLSQAGNAVNVAWSSLSADQANSFLTEANSVYGSSLNKPAHESLVVQVKYSGTVIPKNFLSQLETDAEKGIFLLEGAYATTRPLKLEVYDEEENRIFFMEMPLSVSSVEEMYRRGSLRIFTCPSSISTPGNNPDVNGAKDVFFLHGFSVTEKESRAWNAEMFKRLWQSGAKMKFWGITWKGDEGVPDAFHYQDNVYNAFRTASALATLVNGNGTGDKIVMAHSLGNMVVSSAIQDHGMNVAKYFMLNSAVPSEAYNPTLHNTATNNVLVHEEWRNYANRTWSSEWHTHFPATDDRSKLTWKNRFPNVASVAYNYYSTGDEVLELFNGTPGPAAGGLLDSDTKGRYAWHKQEVYKGRDENVVFDWATTDWSGWGFRENWLEMRMYSAEEANALESLSLTTNTVFTLYPSTMNTNVISRLHLDENLAKGIPALSPATGRESLNGHIVEKYNLNAGLFNNQLNSWWRTDGNLKNKWLHSDIKDAAYYFVYKLFDNFVDKGGLK